MTSELRLTPTGHAKDCNWHVDQYPWECTCGFIPRKKAMDNLIAQDVDLIDKLRDEDSYYRLQEKHWCIDAEELERQRLAAADRIEALEAEVERLRDTPNRIWAEARDSEWDEGFNYAVKLFRAALAGDSHDQ